MHIKAITLVVLASLSVFWIIFVPVYYAFTRDSDLTRLLGHSKLVLCLAVGEVTVLPVVLVIAARALRLKNYLPRTFGAAAGLVFGLWLACLFLTLPYLGVYPNVLGAFLGTLLSGGRKDGPSYYFSAYAVNLFLWPGVGQLLFRPKGLNGQRG